MLKAVIKLLKRKQSISEVYSKYNAKRQNAWHIQYIYNFNVILENYTLHITHEDWLLDFSI
jgi:hypothetical protein